MDNIYKSNSVKIEKRANEFCLLILAIVLLIPFFNVVYFINYNNKIKNILFYGVETQATVVENSFKSLTENIYYFEYVFYDNQGNQHNNTTKSNYDFNTAKTHYDAGVITIKYDIKTFDSIEIPFEYSDSFPIFDIFLCIADTILWIHLIIELIKLTSKKGIILFGKKYIASYSSKQISNTIGQFDLYKIIYVWKDENGNTHEGISKDSYLLSEAKAFETAKEFKIKAHNNNSVIITNPKWLDVQNKKVEENKQYYYCIYCGTKILNNENSCPNCGAPRKEIKEKIDL